MNIKLELLLNSKSDSANQNFENINIDINKIIDTIAINALSEIQNIIQNDSISDFEAINQIICIFKKYNISPLI